MPEWDHACCPLVAQPKCCLTCQFTFTSLVQWWSDCVASKDASSDPTVVVVAASQVVTTTDIVGFALQWQIATCGVVPL